MSPETIRKAHAVQPVTALQTQYSLLERFPENQILDTCEELGIGFVPWGPVARGFFGDKFNEYSRFSEDSRYYSVASFSPEALKTNLALLNLIRDWGVPRTNRAGLVVGAKSIYRSHSRHHQAPPSGGGSGSAQHRFYRPGVAGIPGSLLEDRTGGGPAL